MPSIAQNSTVNISLAAGDYINVTGSGSWSYIATVSGREIASGSYVGHDVIGPFTKACSVGITCGPVALSYTTSDFVEGNVAAQAFTTEDVEALKSVVSGYGNRSATRAWAGALQPQTSFTGYSWQVRAEIPVTPDKLIAVRFAVVSHPTVAQTFIAACASAATWAGKNLAGGGAWQYAGWDGSDHGAFAPIVIPAKGQKHSDLVWTDWASVSGEARTDGGTWAVVVLRVFQQAGAATQTVGNASTDTPMGTLTYPKLKYLTDFQSGDFVSTNRDTFAGGSNPGCTPIVAVEWLTSDGATTYTVADFGDSIETGYSTAIRGNGPLCDAAAVMNGAGPYRVSPIMQGSAGEPVDAYLRRLDMWTKTNKGRPSICIFRPYSRNNGTVFNRAIAGMAAFLDICAKNNITPILSTGMYESSDTNNNAGMLAVNAVVRSVAAERGVVLLELEDLWGASAPLADGIHPGDTEQALMVPRYVAAITAAIQQRTKP